MEFKEFIITLLFVSLFAVCITSFMSGLGQNYEVSASRMQSEYIDFDRIEAQVNETSNDANAWSESFRSDNIFVAIGTIVMFSIWGLAKLMWTASMNFITIYLDIASTLFGLPHIITGVITSVIIVIFIFAVWRAVKQG